MLGGISTLVSRHHPTFSTGSGTYPSRDERHQVCILRPSKHNRLLRCPLNRFNTTLCASRPAHTGDKRTEGRARGSYGSFTVHRTG